MKIVLLFCKRNELVSSCYDALLASATRRAETEGLGETTLKKIKK